MKMAKKKTRIEWLIIVEGVNATVCITYIHRYNIDNRYPMFESGLRTHAFKVSKYSEI